MVAIKLKRNLTPAAKQRIAFELDAALDATEEGVLLLGPLARYVHFTGILLRHLADAGVENAEPILNRLKAMEPPKEGSS